MPQASLPRAGLYSVAYLAAFECVFAQVGWRDAGEAGMAPECSLTGDEYLASSVCSPATKAEWAKRLAVPQQRDACSFDFNAGKIICDTEVACDGGSSHFNDRVHTRNTMEYNCRECADLQKASCCSTCNDVSVQATRGSLSVAGKSINEVTCHGCGANEIETPKEAQVKCSHNQADGSFKCQLSAHCELGKPNIITQNFSYACKVTPCDTCKSSYARAQCCVACLNNYCSSGLTFEDRRVCRGCNEVDVPRLAPAPPPQVVVQNDYSWKARERQGQEPPRPKNAGDSMWDYGWRR